MSETSYREALAEIEWARKTNKPTLDLVALGLEKLPPEIGQLKDLEILDLRGNLLTGIPPEIGQLNSLRILDLRGNRLKHIPPEIGQLSNLKIFIIDDNELFKIPPEIGQLSNLQTLRLGFNQITAIAPELTYLKNLKSLKINGNKLVSIPTEIGQLELLQELYLGNNRLVVLPPQLAQLANLETLHLDGNEIESLPWELSRLSSLKFLCLSGNHLAVLPRELNQLSSLQHLDIARNQLTDLPRELGQLTNLQTLYLSENRLTDLPRELGQLTNLQTLYLSDNHLTELPGEIGLLSNLRHLDLSNNELIVLPAEVGQMSNLEHLDLRRNQITSIPPEFANLNRRTFLVAGNPLISPPKTIFEQGDEAFMAFLRESLRNRTRVWRSKLLVVGEGGVGKTSLIRHLRGLNYVSDLETTHGIAITDIPVRHPTEADVEMMLSTWDFGGQEIYHATHQFFYSDRALFILAWNARLGYEQGKLTYWLDTIKALAPESPVLIVATFVEGGRDADLPLLELERQYPQIVGMVEISNATGAGVDDLKRRVAELASELPLMGEIWPESWRNAADAIRELPEIDQEPEALTRLCETHLVDPFQARVLLNWMHALGDILYFDQNPELRDTVILNPQWISEQISAALEHPNVINGDGVFTRSDMAEVWGNVDRNLREVLLRFMEQFDLSYLIPEDKENRSLIVERLAHEEADYHQDWHNLEGENELVMRFRMPESVMPAGIPTWFIARSHRFTMGIHWRTGALFQGNNREHLALVRAFPNKRYVELAVRGPAPHNFFALLRDGFDVTLDRYPGLAIQRTVPCPGHDGAPCTHEFQLQTVERALHKGRQYVECPIALEDVLVSKLAFGVKLADVSTLVSRQLDDIKDTVIKQHQQTRSEANEMRELLQREFTTLFRAMQHDVDSTCPNVFTLSPIEGRWYERPFGQQIQLQLFCQMPGEWHPLTHPFEENTFIGNYQIPDPAKWLRRLAPHLNRLVEVLQFTIPVVGPAVNLVDGDWYDDEFKNQIAFSKALVDKLETVDFTDELKYAESLGTHLDTHKISGADLRVMRHLLDELDPSQHWGGLQRVLTPEGHYLWLCEHHAKSYLDWVGKEPPMTNVPPS